MDTLLKNVLTNVEGSWGVVLTKFTITEAKVRSLKLINVVRPKKQFRLVSNDQIKFPHG